MSLQPVEDFAQSFEFTEAELSPDRDWDLRGFRERQELASRLHDSIGQMLFSIGVIAHFARAQRDPDALLAALSEVEATAADAGTALRHTLEALGDVAPHVAFELRLDGEIRLFEKRTACNVLVTRRGESRPLPEPTEQLLVDAAIEGLRNAVKHAAAQRAVIRVDYRPRSVALAVQTKVVGDNPLATCGKAAGVGAGLALLARRAQQLCGRLDLDLDSRGLRVLRLELPSVAI
jgi:LuxR family transcriptional regulator, regulator of acetate metabolism